MRKEIFCTIVLPKLCCSRSRISLRRYRTISESQTLLSTFTNSVPLFKLAGCAWAVMLGSIDEFHTFTTSAAARRSSSFKSFISFGKKSEASRAGVARVLSRGARSTPRHCARIRRRAWELPGLLLKLFDVGMSQKGSPETRPKASNGNVTLHPTASSRMRRLRRPDYMISTKKQGDMRKSNRIAGKQIYCMFLRISARMLVMKVAVE